VGDVGGVADEIADEGLGLHVIHIYQRIVGAGGEVRLGQREIGAEIDLVDGEEVGLELAG